MNIKELIESGGISVLVLMTLVQIAPIKINPWEWLFKLFGKWSSGYLMVEVKQVQDDLTSISGRVSVIERDIEDREIKTTRLHIYRFADEISRGVKHSKEFFDQILDDINTYENYCREHPDFKNDKANASIAIIRESYKECMKNNTFL